LENISITIAICVWEKECFTQKTYILPLNALELSSMTNGNWIPHYRCVPWLRVRTGKRDSINYKELKNNVASETQQINDMRKIVNMIMKGFFLKSVQTPRSFLNTARLTLILLMWRIGWDPNSIAIYIKQDATLHSLFISGNCSTCFVWYFNPSSGAHTTIYSIWYL
jgi:hypothetical protein